MKSGRILGVDEEDDWYDNNSADFQSSGTAATKPAEPVVHFKTSYL